MVQHMTRDTAQDAASAGVDLVSHPIATAIDRHFEGLARDELLITRCNACDRAQFPPRMVCYGCSRSGTLRWEAASGRATVWSHVTFHKAYFPPEVRTTPYVVAVVELAEGPRLVTSVVGVPDDDVRIGLPVRVTFRHDGDQNLAVFEPEPTPTDPDDPAPTAPSDAADLI